MAELDPKTILLIADWNANLESLMENPILPDNLTENEKAKKLQEIEIQRERHQLYERTLRKLAKTIKTG
jgi:hypothetical protein